MLVNLIRVKVRKSSASSRLQAIITMVLGISLLLAPQLLNSYFLGILTEILIMSILALSLNLLIGYTGLVSLGHAAFFGVGGYLVGLLTYHFHITSAFTLLLSILAGLIVATLFAPIVLRATGAHFLILTLALGQLLYGLIYLFKEIFRGDDGISGIARPSIGPLDLNNSVVFYYFVLTITLLVVASMYWIVRSFYGLTLRGIKSNEAKLKLLGYNTQVYKFSIYVISAMYASLSGAIYAFYSGYVGPNSVKWTFSGEVLVMVILGGTDVLLGPVLGTAVVILLKYVVSSYTDYWEVILGLVLVVTVMFVPRGLARVGEVVSHFSKKQLLSLANKRSKGV